MAIFVDDRSRIVIQGITGTTGRSFAERMRRCGSPLVAGVTPGKGGAEVAGVPVFNSMSQAMADTSADSSLITVPPPAVLDAVMEAADSGIRLAVVYTEGVPIHDALKACMYARSRGMVLCGPNSAGIVSPGKANLSDLNDTNLIPGPVGIVSKSGTLTYEVILDLRHRGLGVSTVVCLGGDPVVGLTYRDVLEAFVDDAETEVIVLIGEIGGRMEHDAAPAVARLGRPVVAYVAGHSAPKAKRMGHAGAMIQTVADAAEVKLAELRAAGAQAATLLSDVAPLVAEALA